MTVRVTAYPQFTQSEQDALSAELEASLHGLSADLVLDARQLFGRLTPVHWPVEWHLPWWLGQDFALHAQDVQTLTLCNLLGLGYVRLQDAILDDRASQAARRRQRRLADVLHDQSMRRLHGLFDGQVEFWGYTDEAMRQWQLALTDGEHAPARQFADWAESDLLLLAWRGAPIKITAAGACLLADRSAAIPGLTSALDHMLIAQVLLDHLDDWQVDLEAGRFNAFVAFLSDLPQTIQNREANRRRVLDEFFLGEAGDAYAGIARKHISFARGYAEALPCSGLASYLDGFEQETMESYMMLCGQIGDWLHDVTNAIFGLPQAEAAAAIV